MHNIEEQAFKPRYYKNAVIITDFNCSLASAQIDMRFQNVFRNTAEEMLSGGPLSKLVKAGEWMANVQSHRPPVVHNVFTIPHGNVDFAGYALYSTYRVLGRKTRPNIFIHVTDPGEGYSNDRSILITDQNSVMIGPNNGTLGLMKAYFDSRKIKYDLFPIDITKVEALERLRVGSPTYELPRTFHGRDVFAVVGGLIAGGVDPHCLAPDSKIDYEPIQTAFGQGLDHLPKNVGESCEFTCFPDQNFGSLRTNMCMSSHDIQELVSQNAAYEVTLTQKKGWFNKIFNRKISFPVTNDFTRLEKGAPILYIGSTMSTYWDERFIELAINHGNIAAMLEVPKTGSKTLTITRVK